MGFLQRGLVRRLHLPDLELEPRGVAGNLHCSGDEIRKIGFENEAGGLAVVEEKRDLPRRQPRVDGKADCTDARAGEDRFQVRGAIGQEQCHAVAGCDSDAREEAGQPSSAVLEVRIVEAPIAIDEGEALSGATCPIRNPGARVVGSGIHGWLDTRVGEISPAFGDSRQTRVLFAA